MKTALKFLPWIIAFIFAVIIILMIVFKKKPPVIATVKDFETERKLQDNAKIIREWELKYYSIVDKMQHDSITQLKKDSISQLKINRLTRQLRSINTSKATSTELDSLINSLYGN